MLAAASPSGKSSPSVCPIHSDRAALVTAQFDTPYVVPDTLAAIERPKEATSSQLELGPLPEGERQGYMPFALCQAQTKVQVQVKSICHHP